MSAESIVGGVIAAVIAGLLFFIAIVVAIVRRLACFCYLAMLCSNLAIWCCTILCPKWNATKDANATSHDNVIPPELPAPRNIPTNANVAYPGPMQTVTYATATPTPTTML